MHVGLSVFWNTGNFLANSISFFCLDSYCCCGCLLNAILVGLKLCPWRLSALLHSTCCKKPVSSESPFAFVKTSLRVCDAKEQSDEFWQGAEPLSTELGCFKVALTLKHFRFVSLLPLPCKDFPIFFFVWWKELLLQSDIPEQLCRHLPLVFVSLGFFFWCLFWRLLG